MNHYFRAKDILRLVLKACFTVVFCLFWAMPLHAQHSIARQWNEVLLEAIRNDFARPTIHARNLFHTSVALYDSWAVYDESAQTFLLGKTVGGFECPLDLADVELPSDIRGAQEEAMSYATYRLLRQRFMNSPNVALALMRIHEALP